MARSGGAVSRLVPTDSPLRHWRGLAAVALVLFHLMTVVSPLTEANFGHNAVALHSDPVRFQEIAVAHGTPGRDFRVEYPPLAVLGMRAIGRDGLAPLMKHL
ncbi:MAG TPA: hypothetical protein VGI86_15715, partial [Acidimicrobiia bacterium]